MTRASQLGWLFVLALPAWPRTAHALDEASKEAVRSLSNEAASDYQGGQYGAAQAKFERAYSVAKVPKLAVWLARTYEKRGKLVAAYELYRQALSLQQSELWIGDAQQQAQKDAERELGQLSPRLARMTIRVLGASGVEVSVTVDGVPVPGALLGVERLADPGQHQLVARSGPNIVDQKTVSLAEGGKQDVTLSFAAAPKLATAPEPAAPSPTRGEVDSGSATSASATSANAASATPRTKPLRTVGWVSLGVGGAGLGLGAVAGILVAAKYGDLKGQCPNHVCDPDQRSAAESYNLLRTVSTTGFIAGAVFGAVGATLLLSTPTAESKASVGLWVSPSLSGLAGEF